MFAKPMLTGEGEFEGVYTHFRVMKDGLNLKGKKRREALSFFFYQYCVLQRDVKPVFAPLSTNPNPNGTISSSIY